MSMGAWSAEISYSQDCSERNLASPSFGPYWCNAPIWHIDGTIEKGDYKKLKSILKKDLINRLEWLSSQRLDFLNDTEYSLWAFGKLISIWRPLIYVNSQGGDVLESMKIGRLIRQLRINVSVNDTASTESKGRCLSACVNIRIAGINGLDSHIFGSSDTIGVHRPSFNDEYFAGLTSSEAEALYLKYEGEVKAYMLEMGVSQHLIDLTFTTPSSEIHMLKRTKYGVPVITYYSVPWWEERVDARCSEFNSEYKRDELNVCRTMLQVRDSLSSAKEYFK